MKIVYSSREVVTGQRMINQINSVSVPYQSEFPLIDPRRAKTEKRTNGFQCHGESVIVVLLVVVKCNG